MNRRDCLGGALFSFGLVALGAGKSCGAESASSAEFSTERFPAGARLDVPADSRTVRTQGWKSPGVGGALYREVSRFSLARPALLARTSFRSADGRLFELTGNPLDPAAAGAAGDGVADDADALEAVLQLCPSGGVVNLAGRKYRISRGLGMRQPKVTVRGGGIALWPGSARISYAITATDDCLFEDIAFEGPGIIGDAKRPLYLGGICSGNRDYPAPMAAPVANRVTVHRCGFEKLTVGIFVGGASDQPVPTGWSVRGCRFDDMRGFPGQSEGYGLLFSPASESSAVDNSFRQIRRHAIYIAGGACKNEIRGNSISECDNIAIQSNTFPEEAISEGNLVVENTINTVTASKNYGYLSAIGIGFYGRFRGCRIERNQIIGAQDCGIHVAPDQTLPGCGGGIEVSGNSIDMPKKAHDAAIRLDGVRSGTVKHNKIRLSGPIYGIVVACTDGRGDLPLLITANDIDLADAKAVPFRVGLDAERRLSIRSNQLSGLKPSSGVAVKTGRWPMGPIS